MGISLLYACTKETKINTIEGSWRLVSFKWIFSDSTIFEFPGNIKMASGRAMYTENHALWLTRFKKDDDSTYTTVFGDMKFNYDGKVYKETYISANDDIYIGQTYHYNLLIENDTLIQTGPIYGESQKAGFTISEIWVRED